MNELIKQLAEQADEYTDNKIQMWGEYHPDWHSIRDAKFAELIVRECMLCCERVISDHVPESVDTWLNGGEQCIQEIKQHFGVKE